MSRSYEITNIPQQTIRKLQRELIINTNPPRSMSPFPKYVSVYERDSNVVYLPFSYRHVSNTHTLSPFKKLSKLREDDTTRMGEFKFVSTLRPEQICVKDEAIRHLNKFRSCIISSYTGFGKTGQ